jgi:hypothetical protein
MPPVAATKLGGLKLGMDNGPKIEIFHQETEGSEPVVVCEAFPKALAIAFSGYIAKAFNPVPLSQIPISELKPKSTTQVLMKGGKQYVLEEVLDWIYSCGKAGKTVTFRWFSSPAFFDYALIYLACQKLEVSVLQAQVQTRMRDIAALQVHSIDVERIFTAFSGPHMFKDMVNQSIGQAMWEDRLQAYGAYKALLKMNEYSEFKAGTDAVYEKLQKAYFKTPEGKAAKMEQEKKSQEAEAKRNAATQRREDNFKRTVARHHNVDASKVTPTGDGRYTLTTDGRTVRKPQGNRPGFVQLNLGALGVSAEQYRAADLPALGRKEKKSAPATDTTTKAGTADGPKTPAKVEASGGKGKGKADDAESAPPADMADGVANLKIG